MKDRFTCRLCGECCSGDMKVFLNPYDISLLLEYHQFDTILSLYENNLLIEEEKSGVKMSRIRFKEVLGIKFCPYLENRIEPDGQLKGLCTLHPHFKPLVCHLAPLTRELDFEEGSEKYGFMPPHPNCPGCQDEEGEILIYEKLSSHIKDRLDEEREYFRSLYLAPDK